MGITVGELNVKLNLELQRLDAQIVQANQKISRMAKSMQSDIAKAARSMNNVLSTLGVGLSIGGIVSFGKSVLALAGNINDLSRTAGISTDAFQTLSVVAADSGVSGEQLAQSFVQMRKNIEEAAQGTGSAAKSLGTLGLSAKALQAIAPEEQFEVIARSIVNASDKNEAFNAALDILGAKTAPKLTEVLTRLGVEGFGKLSEETAKFRLTPDQLNTLDQAGDKLERMVTLAKVFAAQGFLKVTAGVDKSGEERLKRINDEIARKLITPEIRQKFNLGPGSNVSLGAVGRDSKSSKTLENLSGDVSTAQTAYDSAVKLQNNDITSDQLKDIQANVTNYSAALKIAIQNENTANEKRSKGWAESWDNWEKADAKQKEIDSDLDSFFGDIDAKQKELNESSRKASEGVAQMWEAAADRTSQALADAALSGELSGKKLVSEISSMIANYALRLALINPLINGIFGLTGTNALGAAWSFGGAKAGGGPVSSDSSYLVGENGPELFTPGSSGTITPNDKLSSVTGGGGPNVVYNIDARGADVAAVQRLEVWQRSMSRNFSSMAVAAVTNDRSRGGGAGRGLGA